MFLFGPFFEIFGISYKAFRNALHRDYEHFSLIKHEKLENDQFKLIPLRNVENEYLSPFFGQIKITSEKTPRILNRISCGMLVLVSRC
jgi:hypothetical protein